MTFDPNNLIFFYIAVALLLLAIGLFVYLGTEHTRKFPRK